MILAKMRSLESSYVGIKNKFDYICGFIEEINGNFRRFLSL
jgi:hypothetical protein